MYLNRTWCSVDILSTAQVLPQLHFRTSSGARPQVVDDISIHDVQIALISLSTPHAKNLKGNVVVELNTKESASYSSEP